MLFYFLLFSTSLTLGQQQEKKFFEKKIFFRKCFKKFPKDLISHKRRNEKSTDDMVYPFIKWKPYSSLKCLQLI